MNTNELIEKQILTREFTLAEVLGAISGYLLEDGGFTRIHELIEWVAGGAVFTHQIPSVAPYIQKSLKRQFPQLDDEARPEIAAAVCDLVCAIRVKDGESEAEIWFRLKQDHGESFQVAPMQPFDELEIAPLIPEGAIVVQVSGDEFPDNI